MRYLRGEDYKELISSTNYQPPLKYNDDVRHHDVTVVRWRRRGTGWTGGFRGVEVCKPLAGLLLPFVRACVPQACARARSFRRTLSRLSPRDLPRPCRPRDALPQAVNKKNAWMLRRDLISQNAMEVLKQIKVFCRPCFFLAYVYNKLCQLCQVSRNLSKQC